MDLHGFVDILNSELKEGGQSIVLRDSTRDIAKKRSLELCATSTVQKGQVQIGSSANFGDTNISPSLN
jgi:hypothetical protein